MQLWRCSRPDLCDPPAPVCVFNDLVSLVAEPFIVDRIKRDSRLEFRRCADDLGQTLFDLSVDLFSRSGKQFRIVWRFRHKDVGTLQLRPRFLPLWWPRTVPVLLHPLPSNFVTVGNGIQLSRRVSALALARSASITVVDRAVGCPR